MYTLYTSNLFISGTISLVHRQNLLCPLFVEFHNVNTESTLVITHMSFHFECHMLNLGKTTRAIFLSWKTRRCAHLEMHSKLYRLILCFVLRSSCMNPLSMRTHLLASTFYSRFSKTVLLKSMAVFSTPARSTWCKHNTKKKNISGCFIH